MNTTSLSAELLRELSYIVDDVSSMRKVLKYVKDIVSQQKMKAGNETSVVSDSEAEYTPATKAELIADLNEMCEEDIITIASKWDNSLQDKLC